MLSILLCSVTAGTIYETKDFTEYPEQLLIIGERDAVKINEDGKEHRVMVRKVYPDKTKVDVTAFIDGAEVPYYVTINPKLSLQLDFDHDLEYDMKVSLFNTLKDEKVVALKFETLKKEDAPIIITDAVIREPEKKQGLFFIKNKFYFLGAFIFLAIGIWKRRLILKTYRKYKNQK